MPTPAIGIIIGVLLAIAATTGGFSGFLLALVLGAAGYVVVAQLSGKLDLASMLGGKSSG